MRAIRFLVLAVAMAAIAPALLLQPLPAAAQEAEAEGTLFVNLTSADAWRAGMALGFARNAQAHGHEVVVFLNVDAVRLASTALPQPRHVMTGEPLQAMLEAALADGATVIVCPMCMQVAGIAEGDLIAGATVGAPEITLPAMFGDDVRVMSY